MKSVTFVSQSPTSRGHYSCGIHSCSRAVRHAVFSRETNVTRPGLARSFRRSARRPLELSHSIKTRNLRRTLCRSAYLEVFIAPGAVQSPLRPIVRIVRRNEIACAAPWSRFGVRRRVCAAQQRLIKYEISFTGGKALTEASKSIRSWQINAARDISFSRTYDTLIRRMRPACCMHWIARKSRICINVSVHVNVERQFY